MKAGELDALIAEKVMGWSQERLPHAGMAWRDLVGGLWTFPPGYSTDIAAAWEVVEILSPNFSFSLLRKTPSKTAAFFSKEAIIHNEDSPLFEAAAETAPLAICLAALKAVNALP